MIAPSIMLRRLLSRCVVVAILRYAAVVRGKQPSRRCAGPRSFGRKATPKTKRGQARKKVTDYPLKGVVKKIEQERVTIAHEAIKGFMSCDDNAVSCE